MHFISIRQIGLNHHFTSNRHAGSPIALEQSLRQAQAASLAYFDVFFMCAALGLGLMVLVLLMKRSVAEKGAPVGGE